MWVVLSSQICLLFLTFNGNCVSSDYFKCCCLPSLQITSSSLFFTEKVSKYLALNSDVHKAADGTRSLFTHLGCSLSFDIQSSVSSQFLSSTHISYFFLCLVSHASFCILFLLFQVMIKEAVSPSCASSMCHQLRCPISCCKAP